MALVSANDAEFYYELRGSGPALLLMMRATGDGGVFDRLADLLATSSRSSPTTVGATGVAHVPSDGIQPRPRSRPTTPLH